VEIISGVVATVLVRHYGLTLQSLWIFLFLSILLVITLVDWFHRIIPDVLTLGGAVLGWVGAVVCLDVTPVDSLLGTVVGGGLLFTIAAVYKIVRNIDGMGGGDVKLMAMIGAFLGWKAVFPVLILASLFGAVYGVYLMLRGATAHTAVAFGSFLAPSAALVYVFGGALWQVYLRFVLGQP
jgi:leader peptidase (prepilin peptidase)/N-methyltransferase